MRGGQAFAELVEHGGHQVLQAGDGDAHVQLDGVQTGVSHRLDHVVDVDEMHWSQRTGVSGYPLPLRRRKSVCFKNVL